jgi:hypothetical protein
MRWEFFVPIQDMVFRLYDRIPMALDCERDTFEARYA